MTGRSDYTAELAAEFCSRIAEGRSLRSVCKDEDMPAKATAFVWLEKYESFREQYARARVWQRDALDEEILEIADDASGDYRMVERDGRTVWVFDSDNVQRSRLRVDARKWYASKLAPKKYGDRLGGRVFGTSTRPPARARS